MKLWWCCYAGVDLISEVSCDAPYEWLDKTGSGWEFNDKQSSETFHVSITEAFIDNPIKILHLTTSGFSII
jgi:carbamoyl-phosphate synthase small subunit